MVLVFKQNCVYSRTVQYPSNNFMSFSVSKKVKSNFMLVLHVRVLYKYSVQVQYSLVKEVNQYL